MWLAVGLSTAGALVSLPPGPSPRGAVPFDVDPVAFHAEMGYVPESAPQGRLLHPDGDCSAPTGGTAFGFDDACREHDLSYDLLRFREARGDRVDPRERWAADTRFAVRMAQRCFERTPANVVGCLGTATVYAGAVTLNSARQLYRAPAVESGGQIAASSAALVLGLGLLLAPVVGARAFRRMLRRADLDLLPPPPASGWSGSAGSLVRWADVGREGRRLLARAPVAAGAVRVFVGVESARLLRTRVRLAVAEAERVGAFTRSTVCVAVPTGSGWLNPAAVEGLEQVTRGDVATISVQYAAAPSWLTTMAHPGAHRRTANALLRAVHGRWSRINPGDRPRLVVLGESLGANGVADALRRMPLVTADVDGGLLVGGIGSARWEPIGRVTFVGHDDDPVVHLGLRTLPRLPAAGSAPEGSGHHYGRELEEAWRANAGTQRPMSSARVGSLSWCSPSSTRDSRRPQEGTMTTSPTTTHLPGRPPVVDRTT